MDQGTPLYTNVMFQFGKDATWMSEYSSIRITLFKHSQYTFLEMLDLEGIEHHRLELFSNNPQANGFVETITALSEAMPWNAIAKVIVAWLDARKSRVIIITVNANGNTVFHAKGHSIEEVRKILPDSLNIAVIDTQPDNET